MKKISSIINFFGKIIKPSFSDKVMKRDKINLSEKGESVKTELKSAEVLNKFFSNIVNNLEISKCFKYESFIHNVSENSKKRNFKKKSIN